ncbi:hypothetical protein ACRYCC_10485 [Actinomadura scrupuli]|uniref:hypothetical protein n=1 Tax=Actinomadura scrupuli TaxID=559629 RepID=UPI003D962610
MAINSDNLSELQFPDDSPVLVWYPLPGADQHDRDVWAWLLGSILTRCGPDEWHVVIELPALAEPDASMPNVDAPENLLYPTCFRDSSEIRAVTVRHWQQVREALTHG